MKIFKSGDIILIIILLCFFVASFLYNILFPKTGTSVLVQMENQIKYNLPLTQNHHLSLNGHLGKTCIIIQDNKVWISESPCPHHICEQMGKISQTNSSLICVPNRVLVRIVSNDKDQLDGVTQ